MFLKLVTIFLSPLSQFEIIKIYLQVRRQDNQAEYSCQANNGVNFVPAVQRENFTVIQPLMASILYLTSREREFLGNIAINGVNFVPNVQRENFTVIQPLMASILFLPSVEREFHGNIANNGVNFVPTVHREIISRLYYSQ